MGKEGERGKSVLFLNLSVRYATNQCLARSLSHGGKLPVITLRGSVWDQHKSTVNHYTHVYAIYIYIYISTF